MTRRMRFSGSDRRSRSTASAENRNLSMKRFLSVLATFTILCIGIAAWAEDEVFVRGKDKAVKGIVTKESAKGVVFKDGTAFAAEAIDDIFYEVNPAKIRIGVYRPAFQAEKDSLDPA